MTGPTIISPQSPPPLGPGELPSLQQHKPALKSVTTGLRSGPSSVAPIVIAAAPVTASSTSLATVFRAQLPNKQPRTIADPQAAPKATTATAAGQVPRLCLPPVDKMAMAAVVSPNATSEAPKLSMTSKEWVIPPRPKPGRKPTTDTPPTKRKAQNRAAQRAFRERRAARVGELEQQLDELREAQKARELELTDKIHGLELDLQSFRSRCMLLENMLERERQEHIRAEMQAEMLRRQGGGDAFMRPATLAGLRRQGGSTQQLDLPRQPLRHSATDGRQYQCQDDRNLSISHIIAPSHSVCLDLQQQQQDNLDLALTCGNCSLTGPCACAEEALVLATSGCGKCGFGIPCQCLEDMADAVGQAQAHKRPSSPSIPVSDEKRHRFEANVPLDAQSNSAPSFSGQPAADKAQLLPFQMPSADSMPLKDRCGFCKEGTYCMCTEQAATHTPALTPTAETLPSISQLPQTPPPSEPDVASTPLVMEVTADGAVKLPRCPVARPIAKPTKASSRSCGANGPGTCAQCQADPKSGLFCRLMAAKVDSERGATGGSGAGCCEGKGPAGCGCGDGCCKSGPATAERITLPSLPSLGLSCAEAYQTLSSHRNFDRAADDIGSWLPKLKATTPRPATGNQSKGRQAIEVEAASIMSVLKEFDVRFGREC